MKTGPFFILLLGVLGALPYLHGSSNSSPRAVVATDPDHLYLWINRSELADTGAWTAFFDFGMETGANTGDGGLESVDLRYEPGHLFRFVRGIENQWARVDAPVPLKWKSWQVVRIPLPLSVPDGKSLGWRVALFPHDQKEPVFLPQNSIGQVPPSKHLSTPLQSLNPFHLFHSLIRGLQNENLKTQEFAPLSLPSPKRSLLELQELWPEELVFSLSGNTIKEAEAGLNHAFKFLKMHPYPLIIDTSDSELPALSKLMTAAQLACQFSERPFAPVIRNERDLPDHPRTFLLSWKGDLKERVNLLKRLREKLPETEIIILLHEGFLELQAEEQKLSYVAWNKFKASPLLSKIVDLRKVSPNKWMPLLWQNLLREKGMKWQEMPVLTPPSPGAVSPSPQKRIEFQWKDWHHRFGTQPE